MRTFRLLGAACLGGLLALIGCGGPAESPELVAELGVFRGVVEDGVLVSLEMVAPNDRPALADGTLAQPLTVITEDRDGRRGLAAVENAIELTTQGRADLPADGYSAPGVVVDGCGPDTNAFEVFAGIRNFHSAPLTAVHIVIDEITGSPLDHSLCNSDAVPRNLFVDGQPLPAGLGVIRYGFLAADNNGPDVLPTGGIIPRPRGADTTARAVRWRFRHNGSFQFFGRVFGRVCDGDCSPGTAVNEGPIAGTPTPRFIDTDGAVLAVAEGNGVTYLGGNFTRVGHRTGSAAIVPADPNVAAVTSGHVPSFEGGVVDTAIGDGNGGFYVGGTFTSVGGFDRARLVHILADGSVDLAFTPPANVVDGGTITALALDGSNLWVGRSATPFLSVLSTTNSPTPTPTDANEAVHDILVVGESVFVAGAFTNYGGRNKLVKLSRTTGAVDTDFLVTLAADSAVRVNALSSDGTTLWFGGTFTAVGGSQRNRAAAVAVTTGALQDWNPSFNGEVTTLQQVGTSVYLGGGFTTPRARLAAFASTGNNPTRRNWNPAPNGTVVHQLIVAGTSVFVAGNFTTISGTTSRVGVAAINSSVGTTTPAARSWDPLPSRLGATANTINVRALALSGTRALLGGDFAFAGGTPRARLAAVDLATGALLSANANITNGEVRALALAGNGNLYLGGTFTTIGGVTRNRLAAVNAGTFALQTFNPDVNGDVDALVTTADRLYIGGAFTTVAGLNRPRLTRVGFNGVVDAWPNAPIGTGGRVRAVGVLDNGDVLVGGDVTVFFVVPLRMIRISAATGGLVTNFNANAGVHAIALSADGRTAFIGGDFTTIGGQTRSRVAAIDLGTNTVKTTFTPPAVNGLVQAVHVVGPSLVIGGAFTAPQNRLAVLDADAGADQGIATFTTINGTVRAVTDVGAAVVVGVAATGDVVVTTAGPAAARRTGFIAVHAP